MSEETSNAAEIVELTATIIANYVSKNPPPPSELPSVIMSVAAALQGTSAAPVETKAPLKAAVPVKRSVTPDAIYCLEDGKAFKSLKRHLESHHQMTPQEYRAKWGLAKDYPMVAPNYAAARSELAKASGLGSGGRGKAPAKGKGKAAKK